MRSRGRQFACLAAPDCLSLSFWHGQKEEEEGWVSELTGAWKCAFVDEEREEAIVAKEIS